MKQFLFTILCCWSVISFTSCSKEDLTQTPRYIIPLPALAYLQLPQNRIFAYKDSATGIVDSVVLDRFSIYTDYQPPYTVWTGSPLFGHEESKPGYEYQKISFRLIRVKDSSTFMEVFSIDPYYPNGPSSSANGIVNITGFIHADNVYWTRNIFSYPSNTKISSLTVENKTYTDVIMSAKNYEGDPFYWAKNVGIIKFSVRPHFTYSLCN